MDALCFVKFEAGEVLGILILTYIGNIFLRRQFWLKYMLALQLHIFLCKFSVLVDECLPGFYIIFFKVLHHMTLDI
jgi:hypothetical protein